MLNRMARHLGTTAAVAGVLTLGMAVAPAPVWAAGELTQVGGSLSVDQAWPNMPQMWTVMQEAAVRVPAALKGKTLDVTWSQGAQSMSSSKRTIGADGILEVGAGWTWFNSAAEADAGRSQFTGPLEIRATDPATGQVYTGTVTDWTMQSRPVIGSVKKTGSRTAPTISGQITTPQGKPIKGIQVSVGQLVGNSAQIVGNGITDSRGRFSIATSGTKPGRLVVMAGGLSGDTQFPAYGQAFSKVIAIK